MHHINIPMDLSEKARKTLVQYIGSGLDESRVLPTLVLRVVGANSPPELESVSRFLTSAIYLTIFMHRKGADDHTLKVLGSHCPLLQVGFHIFFTFALMLENWLMS